jgi:hypothetical protein
MTSPLMIIILRSGMNDMGIITDLIQGVSDWYQARLSKKKMIALARLDKEKRDVINNFNTVTKASMDKATDMYRHHLLQLYTFLTSIQDDIDRTNRNVAGTIKPLLKPEGFDEFRDDIFNQAVKYKVDFSKMQYRK